MPNTDLLSWLPPRGAVPPVNAFHTLYMRLTAIGDALMAHAPEFASRMQKSIDIDQAGDALLFGELLGSLSQISVLCSSMTLRLEEIRKHHPALWKAWEQSFYGGTRNDS
jgi:hypothetical protein